MGKSYPREQKEFLLSLFPNSFAKEISRLFYEKYNKKITIGAINVMRAKYGIKLENYRNIISDENQKKWVMNLLPYYSCKEIADLFEKKFGKRVSENIFNNMKSRYHIKRQYTIARTKPIKPFYNEITRKNDNRQMVRIGIKKYQDKGRYVWEQYYNRKIPKGYDVIFLDKNKNNYDIKNLAVIKRGLLVYMIKKQIEPTSKDIIKAASLCFKLDKKIKGCEKNG